MTIQIQHFYHEQTNTLTYIVFDSLTLDAVVIDPVLDFDQPSGKLGKTQLENLRAFISQKELTLHYILETHAHADHLSSSVLLKKIYPKCKLAIGKNITIVQQTFARHFNLGREFETNGSQFDVLLQEGQIVRAGALEIKVMETPGHTPACLSLLIGDNLFTGDLLFMPDFGTGRCDFPAGNASVLFQSVQKIFQLPDSTKTFTGHDYQPGGRALAFQSTIGEHKKNNIHIKKDTNANEYVSFRTARDKTLSAPKLLLPSIQVNMNAGHLPPAEKNGVSYLKLPLSAMPEI